MHELKDYITVCNTLHCSNTKEGGRKTRKTGSVFLIILPLLNIEKI